MKNLILGVLLVVSTATFAKQNYNNNGGCTVPDYLVQKVYEQELALYTKYINDSGMSEHHKAAYINSPLFNGILDKKVAKRLNDLRKAVCGSTDVIIVEIPAP